MFDVYNVLFAYFSVYALPFKNIFSYLHVFLTSKWKLNDPICYFFRIKESPSIKLLKSSQMGVAS